MEVGIFMAKYDFEFKKKVVEAYLRGEGGYQTLSKKYGLKSTRQIGYWVKAYKKFGDEGLKVLENGRVYPFELKLLVVESYLKGNISYSAIGLKYGILNHGVIGSWVKKYKKDGPEALKNPQEGREYTVKYHKKRPSKPKKQKKITEEEYKKLEKEIYHLRMENDFLKAVRRLNLEDEAKTKERLESLTVSEKNTN